MDQETTEKKFKVTVDELNQIWHRSSAEIVGAKTLEEAQQAYQNYLMWGKFPPDITISYEKTKYLYDTAEVISKKENCAMAKAESLIPDDNEIYEMFSTKEFPEELNYEILTNIDRQREYLKGIKSELHNYKRQKDPS